jgi:hypothetical protein
MQSREQYMLEADDELLWWREDRKRSELPVTRADGSTQRCTRPLSLSDLFKASRGKFVAALPTPQMKVLLSIPVANFESSFTS